MDDFVNILVALVAALAVGYIIYRVTRTSGSSDDTKGGYTRPGRPPNDLR